MIGQNFFGHFVTGDQTGDDPATQNGRGFFWPWRVLWLFALGISTRVGDLKQRHRNIVPALLANIARQHPQHAVQITRYGRVDILLKTQILKERCRAGRGHASSGSADQVKRHAADTAVLFKVDLAEMIADFLEPAHTFGDEFPVLYPLLDQHSDQRRQQPAVSARLKLQMKVGHLGRFGHARVNHDHRALGVLLNRVKDNPRSRKAMALPGILADKKRNLAILEVAVGAAAKHLTADPELAGFFLGQGVAAVFDAKMAQHAVGIQTAQVITLAAATQKKDLVAAVPRLNLAQPCRDLSNRCVPVHALVGAVLAPPKRAVQPVGAVLIVIEPRSLVAQIAARAGVFLVALDLKDLPTALAAQLNLDPAVNAAQIARRLYGSRLTSTHNHDS